MPAIEVQGVSKKYRVGQIRSTNLVDHIPRLLRGWVGRNGGRGLPRDEFWALRDVSFAVEPGDNLGIIGPNGAGKSTILKLLARITRPTQGTIDVDGRVGALIELGAGFHPELTGRDNVYLYGSILGMTRREIDRNFDRIVEFAELEKFMDTPVKRYSSGMAVRLGFAVAAHLAPDILLVDEVLAVGDLGFQTKCLEKIRDLQESGTTLIYVSHQLHTVERLCRRVIVLANGAIRFDGSPASAIDTYRTLVDRMRATAPAAGSGEVRMRTVELLDATGTRTTTTRTGDRVVLRIHYSARRPVVHPVVAVTIHTVDRTLCTTLATDADQHDLGELTGEGHLDLAIDLNLLPNLYVLGVSLLQDDGLVPFDRQERALRFAVDGGARARGFCFLPHTWSSPRTTPQLCPAAPDPEREA